MSDNNDAMLTTLDNPYNPFTHFDEWRVFDETMGYYTCPYIARMTHTSDDLSEEQQALDVSKAMDSIVKLNITGNYVIVTKDNFDNVINNTIKK